MSECVLCDWRYDPFAEPLAAFLPDSPWPLQWDGTEVRTVHLADELIPTIPLVALAAHWGQAHAEQLRLLVGAFELDWFPRAKPLLSDRGGP